MKTKNTTHEHDYRLGKSGKVETCYCGKFRHVGDFAPIAGIDAKNTTHTPGPWRMGIGSNTVIVGAEGFEVCRLMPINDANARLIAAAPDLLAIVKLEHGVYMNEAWAIEEVDRMVADNDDGPGRNPKDAIEKLRRAAIAKAEGK